MVRLALWGLVLAMFVANGAFDVSVAHVAYRCAEKVAGQDKWGNPTYYPPGRSSSVLVPRLREHSTLPTIARYVFESRYVLTALPLLVILYFLWTRDRVGEGPLALAIALSAFALAAKVHLWETLWRATDVYAAF